MSTALLVLPRLHACAARPRLQLVSASRAVPGPCSSLEASTQSPLRLRPRRDVAELAFYRKYTEGLLRRYVAMSMEAGRVPSLMGKEVLPGSASSYAIHSFEDTIIFICDMEACLKQLDSNEQWLIRRIALQQFTQEEAAQMLQHPRRTVMRKYNEAMNLLTGILLDRKLLVPFSGH